MHRLKLDTPATRNILLPFFFFFLTLQVFSTFGVKTLIFSPNLLQVYLTYAPSQIWHTATRHVLLWVYFSPRPIFSTFGCKKRWYFPCFLQVYVTYAPSEVWHSSNSKRSSPSLNVFSLQIFSTSGVKKTLIYSPNLLQVFLTYAPSEVWHTGNSKRSSFKFFVCFSPSFSLSSRLLFQAFCFVLIFVFPSVSLPLHSFSLPSLCQLPCCLLRLLLCCKIRLPPK